jgi:hypothetical protein
MAEMVNAWGLFDQVSEEEEKNSHPDAYAVVLTGVEAIVNHYDTYSVQFRNAQDVAELVVQKVCSVLKKANDFKGDDFV